MLVQEPEHFYDAMAPMIYFSCALGMGVLQPPRSRTVHVMMILYTIGYWIIIIVFYYFGLTHVCVLKDNENSSTIHITNQVVIYMNVCSAVSIPLLVQRRHKASKHFVEQVEKLDDNFATMLGIQKNYKREFILQVCYILIICVGIFMILTFDIITWILCPEIMTAHGIAAAVILFHHPITLVLVADIIFINYVRYLGKKFHNINTVLLNLVEPRSNLYHKVQSFTVAERITKYSGIYELGNIGTRNLAHKRYLLQIIRRNHLRVCKVAQKLNQIFGIQNLISMGVSLVMLTGLLYVLYHIIFGIPSLMRGTTTIISSINWCLLYFIKIFMISHICDTVSYEAGRSGQIIYELIEPTIDKEFHKEIQEFALQMIQNPVKFTASGFFTMDHNYIQGVIGSITTYLVILIQISGSPSTQSTASTERTSN